MAFHLHLLSPATWFWSSPCPSSPGCLPPSPFQSPEISQIHNETSLIIKWTFFILSFYQFKGKTLLHPSNALQAFSVASWRACQGVSYCSHKSARVRFPCHISILYTQHAFHMQTPSIASLLNWKGLWIFLLTHVHLRNYVFNSCGRGIYIWCWTGLVCDCLQSAMKAFMQSQNHFEYRILHPSPGDTIVSNDNLK